MYEAYVAITTATLARAPRTSSTDRDGDGDDPGLCAPMRAHTDIAGAETAASIVQASFWFDK
jgi:hypothetical protein